MSTRRAFNPLSIPKYLLSGPAHIWQVLADQGPTAASGAARHYSMALCVLVLAIYILTACALGFFAVPMNTQGGLLNLSDSRVLVGIMLVGFADLAAILAALWAAILGIMALFRRDEAKGAAATALIWAIALAIFYVGVFAGILGYRN